MNSGGSFQDLLNTDTITEGIDDVKSDLLALENEVKDNILDITANTLGIGQNTTAISNNGVLINNNTSNIALETLRITVNANEIIQHDGEITTLQLDRISDLARITINEQNIQTNVNNIQTNTIALTTLGNDVLRRDGSVLLNVGYTPTLSQSISTKDYVDSHTTSNAYLRVDGSNAMLNILNMNGFGILSVGGLDMAGSNVLQVNQINGYPFNYNMNLISTNEVNIATNTSAISTNTTNITNLDNSKLNLSGGTMS